MRFIGNILWPFFRKTPGKISEFEGQFNPAGRSGEKCSAEAENQERGEDLDKRMSTETAIYRRNYAISLVCPRDRVLAGQNAIAKKIEKVLEAV